MFGANMFGGTHFGENYFGDGTGAAPSSTVNPFGDVRRGSFGPLGTRIRRSAVWLVWPLLLLVG